MMLLWTTILAVLGAVSAQKLTVSSEARDGLADFASKKVLFGVYKITDQNHVIQETRGPKTSSYAEFITNLSKTNPDECRYGLLDYQFVNNGEPKEELVVFLWSPETASKEEVERYALEDKVDMAVAQGLEYYVVAHKDADLDENIVESRIKKFSDLAAEIAENERQKVGSQ